MTKAWRHPDPEELMAWSDDELDASGTAQVAEHVNACATCRADVDDMRRVRSRANEWRVEPAPSTVRAAVMREARPAAASGPGFWRRYRWQLAATAAVLVLGLFAAQVTLCGSAICLTRNVHSANTSAAPTGQDLETSWQSRPRIDLGIPSEGAAVLVVWFVDYECPGCAAIDAPYMDLLERYVTANPGIVKLVVRDWPWNADCNPNLPVTLRGHEASCAAVVATRIAREHGVFAEMKRWLFTHQPATIEEVRRATEEIAGTRDFDERYPTEIATLQGELAALANSGVHSTPSCFVNGVSAVRDTQGRLLLPADLGRVIELEIRRQGHK